MKAPALALLLAAALFAGPALAVDDHVALVKNVTGPVNVYREGTELTAVNGMELAKSDRVVSGVGASSGIVFKDGTLLTVGASSEVLIRDYVFEPKDSKYAFSLYLTKGTAIYSSGKIGKLAPESVSVDTPKATIGVRGTRFIVTAE